MTSPPVQRGSRFAFVARFLGRRLEYTYEVIDFVPNERLVMAAHPSIAEEYFALVRACGF